jgi:ketosteroid isomerase-like protein
MTDNKQVVREFLKALGSGDAAKMKPLLADDAVAICTGTSIMAGSRSKEVILSTLGMLHQVTKAGIEFKILHLTEEAGRVAAEVEGTSTIVTGVPYNNQYHFLFFFRNGQIYRIKEYLDSKLTDEIFRPLMAAAR